MTPDDYECRRCTASMFVPDGCDPLDYDVRLCMECTMAEIEQLRESLMEIESLASWNCDENADPQDDSPVDMTAHVNGLIVQECRRALRTENGGNRG